MRDLACQALPYAEVLPTSRASVDERTRSFAGNSSLNFDPNFNRGADQPWRGPSAESPGWHKDGWFFYRFLDSPEQALPRLVIWREIGPKSGGTFYAPDSVPLVCRQLLAHPEGLPHTHNWGRLIHACLDFREVDRRTLAASTYERPEH